MSGLLSSFGHEVIVANARQVKLISSSSRKDDRLDAQTLARLARVDPQLLRPIRHRSEKAQADLMQVRVRGALVDTRTSLVNRARGLAKATRGTITQLRCGPNGSREDGGAAGSAGGGLETAIGNSGIVDQAD